VVENLDDMVANFGEQSLDGATDQQLIASPLPAAVALEEAIGLVAVTPGAGFAALFRELGVGAVIDGGQTMNPSTAELVAGIASLPNRRIVILPNNGNILLAAQQAAELAVQANPTREVVVVPTKTLPQGIAAVLACNPTVDDLARSAAHMQDHVAQVDTGEVAQAVRSAEFDGVTVEVGDFIGLHDGRLVTSAQTLEAVVLALLEQMAADESELITLYHAAHIAAGAAENLKEIVRTHYPDQHVELAYGGQANFHYILSTE
jgi:dihydroxyacetone kinase-like predicted kinase